MKYILLSFLLAALLLPACSELQENPGQPDDVTFHPPGIMDPSSPDFHGNLIKNNNWDMDQCQQCHGGNFHGGQVDVACTSCHADFAGPENCSTCHGSEKSPAPPEDLDGNLLNTDPAVGAHQVHLVGNVWGKSLSCAECHVVPTGLHSPGHIDPSDDQAEVIMNNFLANLITNDPMVADPVIFDPTLPIFRPEPTYNPASATCAGTYCHGTFKNGNSDNVPVWNDPGSAECGSCHGNISRPTLKEKALPRTVEEGGTHPGGMECYLCHGGVIDQNMKFINVQKHIDGKVNFLGTDYKY